MSTESITSLAIVSFVDFVHERSPSGFSGQESKCLAGYIHAWVRTGHGVRDCQGDFQTFLIAVAGIINRWQQDPTVLDYAPDDPETSLDRSKVIKRRVDRVFMDEDATTPPILDPHFFAKQTFKELRGGHDLWWS